MTNEQAPHIGDFRVFWDNQKRTALADILHASLLELKLSPADFEANGAFHGYSVAYFFEASKVGGSQSTYERARRGSPKVKPDSLTVILYGIGALSRDRCNKGSVPRSALLTQLDQLFADFLDIAEANKRPNANQMKMGLGAERPVQAAIGLIAQLLNIGDNVGPEAEKRFFREDESYAYFDTYRFSYTPGFVHKSFTVVIRGRPELPLITFRNFVRREDGTERRSSGMVVPFSQQTAFIGHSDNGHYSKVMVFRNSNPQNTYRGLVISEEPEDAVAARVLMKRSDHTDSRNTFTGKIPVSDVGLNEDDLESIRNRIPFILEGPVFDDLGRPIGQDEIVEKVGGLMRDVDTGIPKLTQDKGDPFNPAADRFYTFNSALRRR